MIKLVIFDAGDILYDWEEAFKIFDEEFKKFFKRHEVQLRDDYRELWNTENIGKAATIGKIDLQEAHRRQMKELGMAEEFFDEINEVDKKVLKSIKLKDPEAKEAIEQLKKSGYKVAILTDSPHKKGTQHEILQTIGMGGLFDGIFISCEIGHMKPDKEAYMAVLDAFNLNPSEAVFVAHDEDELVGAKKVGIKTISYRNLKFGDFVIQNLKEIPGILEKIK
jgi:putative hydrolase of the HAD superfamily